MTFLWREHVKKVTTPHQRHQLIMLRERIVGPYTRATARWRTLPDFIIIGAPRSGTTHLFNTLRHHPQIKTSRIKEVHFFDKDERFQRGELGYRSYFPLTWNVREKDLIGEATPRYLNDTRVADRIASIAPKVKIIALLRNPTDRFISGYHYQQQKAYNRDRTFQPIDEYVASFSDISEIPGVESGIYHTRLNKYDDWRQKGNLCILESEQYFTNIQKTFDSVSDFLEISHKNVPTLYSKNHAMLRTEPSNKTRAQLDEFYAPYNRKLFTYIGKSFTAWPT